jgi:hypothetical protein
MFADHTPAPEPAETPTPVLHDIVAPRAHAAPGDHDLPP